MSSPAPAARAVQRKPWNTRLPDRFVERVRMHTQAARVYASPAGRYEPASSRMPRVTSYNASTAVWSATERKLGDVQMRVAAAGIGTARAKKQRGWSGGKSECDGFISCRRALAASRLSRMGTCTLLVVVP